MTRRSKSHARLFVLGAILQGLVLGVLLSLVVVELWTTGADVQLFEYMKF